MPVSDYYEFVSFTLCACACVYVDGECTKISAVLHFFFTTLLHFFFFFCVCLDLCKFVFVFLFFISFNFPVSFLVFFFLMCVLLIIFHILFDTLQRYYTKKILLNATQYMRIAHIHIMFSVFAFIFYVKNIVHKFLQICHF